MWTRKQLKEKGKASFRANYWKAVLVAFILIAIAGGTGLSASIPSSGTGIAGMRAPSDGTSISSSQYQDLDDYEDLLESLGEDPENYGGGSFEMSSDGLNIQGDDGTSVHVGPDGIDIQRDNGPDVHLNNQEFDTAFGIGAVFVGFAIFLIVLVGTALALALAAFLLNPIEVGCRRFFTSNLNRKAEVKDVAYAFDHNYLSGVKTMFLRDIFTILWTLLFIIPGIVKSYEYRMIPYLIAENPEMDYKAAFAQSKQMMNGQKWRTFVLDLSFIGWWFLSVVTLGIVGVFYVVPYYSATSAALYEALRYGDPQPAGAQGFEPQPPFGQPTDGQPYQAPTAEQPAQAAGAEPVPPAAQAAYDAPAAEQPAAAAPAETPAAAAPAETPQATDGPVPPQA